MKIFKMLRSKGTLIINTFVIENGENASSVAEGRQFLLELFRHHFGGHCYYMALPYFNNKLLVCSLALSANAPMTEKLFRDRMKALPEWLQRELATAETRIEQEAWRRPTRAKCVLSQCSSLRQPGDTVLGLSYCACAEFVVFSPVVRLADGEDPALIVQEVICPRGADHCFKVEDYILREEAASDGTRRIWYQRRLMDDSEDNVVLSVADLQPDKPDAPFSAQNALNWTVLKTSLSLQYTKGIVAQMFVTGCVQLTSTERTRRTLMVGLGGASVPNFLVELDPNHQVVSVELEPAVEYIARKWFGLVQSPRQKVVVRDGVDFIQRWTESEGHFDCLIIDACKISVPPPGQKYPLICPFFEAFGIYKYEGMLNKIFKMLRPKGTLIVNVFAKDDVNASSVAEGRQFLLELFRHHFGGHCYYMALPYFNNKLLVCSLALSANAPMTEKLFRDRMKALPEWLQRELATAETRIEQEAWRRPTRVEM
uniref:Spermine synthase n=1 Tax=Globodera rostochiensis TaxID=31243 RepID=A0A914H573_GLORO